MIRITLFFVLYLLVTSVSAQAEWHDKVRTLRYMPDGEDFVIVNGNRKFTRALYGTNTAFRIETGDVPEFAFFMPRMGGNLHFALITDNRSIWLNDAKYIESRYRAGSRIYSIKDPILGEGEIIMTALAMSNTEGLILKLEFNNIPQTVELAWIYGGASDVRMNRNGDMNADPESVFYLLPEYCKGNRYSLTGDSFELHYGEDKHISGIFPSGSSLRIGDARMQENPRQMMAASPSPDYPVVIGKKTIGGIGELYMNLGVNIDRKQKEMSDVFDSAETARKQLAERIKINTPDPFFNTLGGTLAIAADAIWESSSYLHGAIGWRTRLPGWRGAYAGDFFGWHDRAREHFNAYGASQMTIPANKPVMMDTTLNLARSAKVIGTPMYSSGYISPLPNDTTRMSHYDMNIVYIDALLWHLNWTGDLEYAAQMWPVLERHLAWEKQNFDPDGDGLYDAYCCIWASDALQYSSGAVTHSSAYNYRANAMAATIARKIGKDPMPYETEARKIWKAVNSKLWLKDRGWWAEYQEMLGNGRIHPNAAVWTIYHAIDSNLSPDQFKAYQAARYIDTEIPHIPVRSTGYEDDGSYVVSTTNWLPYFWSINNVAFAESAHTALALWQAGHNESAFKLFKGTVLDAMYMGGSPGNVGQVSFYDAARGETYRDFADPTGTASRALVQGLFGIYPDLMNDRLEIRPGLPAAWDHASFSTPDVAFDFRRNGDTETYTITQNLPKQANLILRIPALKDGVGKVTINGQNATGKYEESVGKPVYRIEGGKAKRIVVTIQWNGKSFGNNTIYARKIAKGDRLSLSTNEEIETIIDPQNVLGQVSIRKNTIEGLVQGTPGHRTIFARVKQGDACWYMPIGIEVVEPVEILLVSGPSDDLAFSITNHSAEPLDGTYSVNDNGKAPIHLDGKETSKIIRVKTPDVVMGSNRITVAGGGQILTETNLINWEIPNTESILYDPVDLSSIWNDRVVQIFRNKYLSPRSPYTTLQIPTQGIGEWCVPAMTANINDKGIRKQTEHGIFKTPMGIPFTCVEDSLKNNIVYTSLWDNYPDSVRVPLTGKASHAYLLMAGSTNHMQSHMVNGTVTVTYTDGTSDQLELINPETWAPIEQDYFTDGAAFKMRTQRPYRVQLSTGLTTRDMGNALGLTGASPRTIDGGAATILDLPLNKEKELKELSLKTEAIEVVIGLMGITLVR